MVKEIPIKEIISYSCLAIPLSFAGIAIYINAPDYYATQYGISLGTLGFILLLLRFIDAIQDPLIGYFSDKYLQYRKQIIIASLILLPVSFLFLFNPLGENHLFWFITMVFISTSAFSVATINLNTIGAMWTDNKNKKTTIIGMRESFGVIGLLLALVIPTMLQNSMDKEQSFLIMSIILICLTILTTPFFISVLKKIKLTVRKEVNTTLVISTKIPKNIKLLYSTYTISMLAAAIPAVLVLFFIRDRLNLESYTGLFLITYFASGALGILIWRKVSKSHSKQRAWLYSMVMALFVFIWAYFLKEGDLWQYLLICLFSGIAFGADLVLPHSILSDYVYESNNEQHATAFYGILAFIAKFSFAISAAIAFPLLEGSGFAPAKENTSQALNTLSLIYGLVPCIIKLLSIFLLWRSLNEDKINNINRSYSNVN